MDIADLARDTGEFYVNIIYHTSSSQLESRECTGTAMIIICGHYLSSSSLHSGESGSNIV